MRKIIAVIVFVLSSVVLFSIEETRLLRFPTIYEDTVVFCYAGDLYIVSINGGVATRMTSHEGYEMFPHFSPDGKTIAFTAQYDGNTEVYIMPLSGGTPKRITYTATLPRDDISDRMGPNNIVMGWTKKGDYVIYRSRGKSFNDFKGQLFLAPIDGSLSVPLPLSTGSWCSYSPNGKKIAFNRVFREFRTWKYYKGGMADDIWIYDFNSHEIENITNNPSQDIFPMWYKDKIYFLSDRDKVMNLFVYDIENKETKKLTNLVKYDIKFPSLGKDKIIFESGGYLYYYNLKESKTIKLTVRIREDFAASRTVFKDVNKSIKNVSIAPDGSRITLSARGDVFSIPVYQGIYRNLTNSSDAHDRNPVWSPDGKYIAYISDKSGEYQIYIETPDKPESEIQLTEFTSGYIYKLKWSPDSKYIMWNNKKLELNYINIDTKRITNVHTSDFWEITNFAWSPDNNWIAFSDKDKTKVSKVYLYDVKQKKTYCVTSEWYDSFDPVFSHDGKYLFFVSNRDFNPIYSDVEWNVAYKDMSRMYFVTLSKDTKSPFALKNTEVFSNDTARNRRNNFKVDIKKIESRIEVLPMTPGNYSNITYVNEKLYFFEQHGSEPGKLRVFDFRSLKATDIGNYSFYQISSDFRKILLKEGDAWYVTDLNNGYINPGRPLELSNLQISVDLKAEWMQIFNESWRQMRDYFYDPTMHRVDWNKQYTKYAELLPYVSDRNDLNYLIGEMIGELNTGHAYVGGGDRKNVKKVRIGMLGAEFERDKKSGYYMITKVYRGENWKEELKSPLNCPGVKVFPGEYIISINGYDVSKTTNIYSLLIDQVDKIVEIEIAFKPNDSKSEKFLVKPIADESELIYFNWVYENIKKVDIATGGEVGYIHLPDMSTVGLNEFVKYYYPQLTKRALIIDNRGNSGGNVSPILIERLQRELSMLVMSRDVPETEMKPDGLMIGPKVLLIDQYSASDGDLFAYQFRRHRLGPIIGVKSWGGVVGIRSSLPFVDGSSLYKPEFAHFDETGWIIEGIGVEPDILIDNDPYQEYMGNDYQLNKAIEVIMDELNKMEQKLFEIPDFYYEYE